MAPTSVARSLQLDEYVGQALGYRSSDQVPILRKAITESRKLATDLAAASNNSIQAIDKGKFGVIWDPRELFRFLNELIGGWQTNETALKSAYGLVEAALDNLKTRLRSFLDIYCTIQGRPVQVLDVEGIRFHRTQCRNAVISYSANFLKEHLELRSNMQMAGLASKDYPLVNAGGWHIGSMLDHTVLNTDKESDPKLILETGLQNNAKKELVPHHLLYAEDSKAAVGRVKNLRELSKKERSDINPAQYLPHLIPHS